MENSENNENKGFFATIVRTFLTGPLSVIFIIFAVVLGGAAVFMTPREEEPQIVVPMVDVFVDFPGQSASEVEQLVSTPLEKLLWQIDGVEHVYSISRRDKSMVTVRFFVGEDRDRAMVRVRDKIEANHDIVPSGVAGWLIKPVEIDDVPIVTLTLASNKLSPEELRRIAEEAEARISRINNIFKSEIHGGYRREFRVEVNQDKLSALSLCFSDIQNALSGNNMLNNAGSMRIEGKSLNLIVGSQIQTIEELGNLPIKSTSSGYVYLRDVASLQDSYEEAEYYHHALYGAGSNKENKGVRMSAVTLSFSKKKGTNAVAVANNILNEVNKLKSKIIPSDVDVILSRNYGSTADEKVNELLSSLFFAVVTVVLLLGFTMGWRSAIVVGIAVPVSFALALAVNYIFGYTINRVTLFALILSLGLVVDDPITNTDNIQRHLAIGKEEPRDIAVKAVLEVIVPVIMSTLAIIVSFAPMFFITGMMGPYMAPMAINVPLTVTFSTLCALTFVPWLALKLLKNEGGNNDNNDGVAPWIRKLYRAMIEPFLKKRNTVLLILFIGIMLIGSLALMGFRKVPLKMLPFDNKNELQILLDMPEGVTLENTDAAVSEVESYLSRVNEVVDIQSYVGLSSPIDFNGLVRHYGLRAAPNNADIRVSLLHKSKRTQDSHGIAMRLRKDLTAIAEKYGAILSIIELPPGPPVLSTVAVEVYGDEDSSYEEIINGAEFLKEQMRKEDSVHLVQIDHMNESAHDQMVFLPNLEKAAYHGHNSYTIHKLLAGAVQGIHGGIAHIENERFPVRIKLELPRADRNDLLKLKSLNLRDRYGNLIPLSELGDFHKEKANQIIHHKNLRPVVFVTAETVGRPPAELILDMQKRMANLELPKGISYNWSGEGEWEVTLRVFRDLGIAFGAALMGIYLLLIVQMGSVLMPLLTMSAIPLVIIGIAPGFWLLNLFSPTVEGYADSVFFTATAMIGMIALGGIVIRNSVVLIEFIQDSVKAGNSLEEAIKESGAVRFRPILLTAATTLLGAWPITMDPVFSGLAWSLIFGLISSTLFTMLVIPSVYYFISKKNTN